MDDGEVYFFGRTVCDVLEEMRAAYESRNFSHLLGLVEEAQSMVNRMEEGLSALKVIRKLKVQIKDLRIEVKELRAEKITLKLKRKELTRMVGIEKIISGSGVQSD